MKKVDWLEDDGIANFPELVGVIKDTIRQCYTIQRKNENKDVDWKGPDLPESLKSSSLPFDEALQVHNLKYDKEEQGRNAIDIIIGIAIQLGIEQGRRIYKEKIELDVKRIKMVSDVVSDIISHLESIK